MKKWFIIISSIILFASLTLSGEIIPLKEAVKKGIQLNRESKNLSIQSKIDALNKRQAELQKRFQVSFNGSYRFQSDKMEILFPDTVLSPTSTIPGKTMEAGSYHHVDLKVGLYQPIYLGGIMSCQVSLNHNRSKETRSDQQAASLSISGKIKASYFRFLILIEEIRLLDALIEQLSLHKTKLDHLYREDLIGQADVLETEIRIDDIKLNRNELIKLVAIEKERFFYLCQTDLDKVERRYTETVGPIEASMNHYKANHPQLKKLDLYSQNLAINRKIVNGQYLPHVNGFFEFHYGKPGIDFFKNSWNPYIQTGVNISFKLFDWNKRKRDSTIIQYRETKIINHESDLLNWTSQQLKSLYQEKKSLESDLKRIDRLIEYSDKIRVMKENLYLEKQVSNLEYLSYLQKLKAYQIKKKQIFFKLELIKTKINTIIGKV